MIIPIAEAHLEYARTLQAELIEMEIDVEISSRNESLNKRIRNAEKQKVPMILVLGDEEVANGSVAVRDRRSREQYTLDKEAFYTLVKEKMNEVHF